MNNSVNLKPCTAYCLQIDVELGGVLHNMTRVRQMLDEIGQQGPGLVVLPELWLSSFDYDRLHEHAVHTPNILAQLQSMACEYNVYLAGSLPEVEGDSNTRKIHNTMYITGPEGVVGKYRKQQLFAPINENSHFTAGDEPQPIDTTLGRLSSLVCYDLRFPELARSQAAKGAKLMVVSAQWPAERRVQWRYLLIARAIENQMYVVACNRCGKDGEMGFAGHSMIIAPDGKVLAEGKSKEEVVSAPIEPQQIHEVRENFRTIGSVPYSFHDENKFVSVEELRAKIAHFKRVGRKIVFTNGCFDILHQGHVTYLEKARRMGDCLIVGLNNDASVKAIKGSSRPMNAEDSRARVLAALGCVDFVVLFGDKTPLELITAVMPDILVKGGDWPVDRIVGAHEVMANGGWALNIPLVDNFSTTGMIQNIKKSCEEKK